MSTPESVGDDIGLQSTNVGICTVDLYTWLVPFIYSKTQQFLHQLTKFCPTWEQVIRADFRACGMDGSLAWDKGHGRRRFVNSTLPLAGQGLELID